MDYENEWIKFVDRADNFYWDSLVVKKQLTENDLLYKRIYEESRYLFTANQKGKEILDALFTEAYTVITMRILEFAYFLKGAPLYDNIYKACFFTSLCMFIHNSKRVKGKSIKQFIYENSLDYYNDKESPNYCPFDYPSDTLLKNVVSLRKQRHRLLSSRPVYNERDEWSAMAKDSEYEWSFMYALEAEDDTIKDTDKRIRNLNKDMITALASPLDDGFGERLKKAYEKFLSKLKKLKYENYLDLQRVAFDHLCGNEKVYGINLYKIEKEYRPFITTKEVNQLLACETVADEDAVLDRSAILSGICFPKVYNDIASIAIISDIEKLSLYFSDLCALVVPVSCLLIDELVENNGLGEDWYDFLCEIINELAKDVLYDPKDVDYTVTSNSQEKFMKVISEAMKKVIYDKTHIIIP